MTDVTYDYMRRLMYAVNKMDGVYYLFAKRYNYNENTLVFLYALDDGHPHSQKEISEEWLIPKTTINSIVKTMLADGMIKFIPGKSSKEKGIVLTDKGHRESTAMMRNLFIAEEKAIKSTLREYSPQFIEALEAFGNNLKQELQNIESKQEGHTAYE